MKASVSSRSGAERVAHQPREQVAAAAVVVPARFGLGHARQAGGEPRDVALAGAEEHRDHVRLRFRVVADRAAAEMLGFAEAKPVDHPQHLVDRDARARILGAPLPHGNGLRDVEPPLTDEDADQRVRDALRDRPRRERVVRSGIRGVALRDDRAVLRDHDAVRAFEILGIGPGERVVEQLLERRAIDARIELRARPLAGRPGHARGL